MKSIILLLLISYSICNQELTFDKKCGLTEAAKELTETVLDLFHNKITFKSFLTVFYKASEKFNYQLNTECIMKTLQDPTILANLKDSPLRKIGLTLLYESNCQKDLGPVLLLLDNVILSIQNIKQEWKNLLLNGLALSFAGMQTVSDCKQAYEAIVNIWT